MGETERYLAVGAILFVLGAIGFLTRRNLIMIFLSAELMLHGVSLSMITFGKLHHTLEGQVFTIFSLTIAACEAALALALILALFHFTKSLDVDLWSQLREPDLPPPKSDDSSVVTAAAQEEYPRLAPAGRAPVFVENAANLPSGAARSSQPVTPGARH